MNKKITLITPAHGNPIALKRTIESVKYICDEIVVGDLCMFEEDSKMIESYLSEYNMKIGYLPFNYLYRWGFSEVLNPLAASASNDIVIYLNVGEIFHKTDVDIQEAINGDYNAWYIDHPTEKHRWWRCYNRHELKWSGRIHEELVGEYRPFYKPLFTFADTDKDTVDEQKAWVMNDVKEMVYWNQLMKIVDDPIEIGATSPGWLDFAKDQYESMKTRIDEKGLRAVAFKIGLKDMYFDALKTVEDRIKSPFKSTDSIEYQGDPKFLGK